MVYAPLPLSALSPQCLALGPQGETEPHLSECHCLGLLSQHTLQLLQLLWPSSLYVISLVLLLGCHLPLHLLLNYQMRHMPILIVGTTPDVLATSHD
jgi:hypothetical protein